MTTKETRNRLIQQLRRASSMELAAVTALDPLVEGASDGSLTSLVSTHRRNARRHRERVLARLKALGEGAPGGAGGRADGHRFRAPSVDFVPVRRTNSTLAMRYRGGAAAPQRGGRGVD